MRSYFKKMYYPSTIMGKLLLALYTVSVIGIMIYGVFNKSKMAIVMIPFVILAVVKVALNIKNGNFKITSEGIKSNFKAFVKALKERILIVSKIIQLVVLMAIVYLGIVYTRDNMYFGKLTDIEKELEAKYPVNIEIAGMTSEDKDVNYISFVLGGNKAKQSYEYLEEVDDFLGKLPEGLLEELIEKSTFGDRMNIYIEPYHYDNVAGYNMFGENHTQDIHLMYYGNSVVSIAAKYMENDNVTQETFSHEFFHALESAVALYEGNRINPSYFDEWNHYNPAKYEYCGAYNGENGEYIPAYRTSQYVYEYDDNMNNVAFVSMYATTFSYEDRAEIFRVLCGDKEELQEVLKSDKINKKMGMVIEFIKTYYPSAEKGTFWEEAYIENANN